MAFKGKAASVTLKGVTKRFGRVTAVNDVSIEVEAGTLVTVLGPSGCGKTTILRIVAGLEMVTSGQVLIGDVDVTLLPPTDRDVSMVFQSYALFPHMTVRENVAYGLIVSGTRKADAYAQAEEGLALVSLQGYGDRLPSELSGGQQQRVAVARALVLEPQVLLFDEPLSNLDAKLRRRVREEIREIQQNLGLTAIYVTHDQEEELAVSDRIVLMRQAAIAQVGSPQNLYEEPADLYVADFIGDANLVEAEVTGIRNGTATVRIGTLSRELPERGVSVGKAHVAIRPEAIQLSTDRSAAGVEATVRKATYLGSHMDYTVECVLGELFVVSPYTGTHLAVGATVTLNLADHGVTLVGD